MRDTAAIGVACRDAASGSKASLIAPIFSVSGNPDSQEIDHTQIHTGSFCGRFQVNMVDWTFYSRFFYTILVNWTGSKAAVLESAKRTSCGVTAMELLQREIREECLKVSTLV